MEEKPRPIPYAPVGLNATGVPRRRTQPRRVDTTGLILSLLQTAAAVGVIAAGPVISGGPWPVRLMLFAGPTIPVIVDLAAAITVAIAATRIPRRRWNRIYLALFVATLLLVVTGLGLAAQWPVYVTDRPWAPPVNDHRLDIDASSLPVAAIAVVWVNPMVLLHCARANDRRRALEALRQHRRTHAHTGVPIGN